MTSIYNSPLINAHVTFSEPLEITNEASLSFDSLHNKYTILYFYPKDNTPGCTTESNDFKAHYETLKSLGAEVFGVSRDSIRSHNNFREKYDLPFELISDKSEALCQYFDVIQEKTMYGKTALGVERSTFIINQEGVLLQEWRKVKVKEHVDAVLSYLQALQ